MTYLCDLHFSSLDSDVPFALQESGLLPVFLESIPWPALALNEDGKLICLNKEMRLCCPENADLGQATLRDLLPEYYHALGGQSGWNRPQQVDVVREVPEGTVYEHIWLRGLPEGMYLLIVMDQTRMHALETMHAQTARLASLGFMVAGVCHEVSNPLAAVHSMVQLMQASKQPIPALFEQGLGSIAGNVKRILELSRRLVGYTRVVDEPKRTFRLDDVIEDALAALRQEPMCDKVAIKYSSNPGPVLFGHPGQIQEVFFNIFLNAIQAMEGRGQLSIVACVTAPRRVQVAIHDTGPGIPPPALDKLFEPFFTTKPKGQGTGLGLAISNQIVNEHGGTIRVENDAKSGAWFFVQLPLCEG